MQSFGYSRHLPLGRPEVLASNLDRWGADEILIQCIDRSHTDAGPDLALLEKVSRQGLSTPLIYGGGIRNVADGIAAVKTGADRICIDALLHDDLDAAVTLCESLGAQAVVAALPLAMSAAGVGWLDYRTGRSGPLDTKLMSLLRKGTLSEALVIDWQHDGMTEAFDMRLLDALELADVPRIAFGGVTGKDLVQRVLERADTVAVAQGNCLNYREHAVQALKRQLKGLSLRDAYFETPCP